MDEDFGYEAYERDDDYNVWEENQLAQEHEDEYPDEEWDEDDYEEMLDILGEAFPDEDPEELHAEHLDGEAYAGPPVGTYAHTAWLMAQSGIMDGDEADRWKDEMKEANF